MKELIISILAYFGLVFIGLGITLVILWLKARIPNWVYVIKRRREIHKRFDKPPLSKCYCVGCKYWTKWYSNAVGNDSVESGYCKKHDRLVADYDFCSYAVKKDTQDILREKNMKKE